MIVRQRPSFIMLFVIFKGSVLSRILLKLSATVLMASLVTVSAGTIWGIKITLTPIPFTLIGLALAIFLGFRNSAAYDRYWEGRKLWGELVIVSRNLTRQVLTLITAESDTTASGSTLSDDLRRRMVYRCIAFAHALRHHLRRSDPLPELERLLVPEEAHALRGAFNRPDFLLRQMAADLRRSLDEKRTSQLFVTSMDASLNHQATVLAACERIEQTPIPFSYTLLLHRTAHLYCLLLPFGLVDSIGFMTPFVVGIVSYTFFGLDALGDELEEPFGLLPNDLPLAAICRTIEINLREALGETDLPEPMAPIDYCLL